MIRLFICTGGQEHGVYLGTFQILDLTYNTVGGAVGGVIYYLGYSRKRKNKIRNRGQLSEH